VCVWWCSRGGGSWVRRGGWHHIHGPRQLRTTHVHNCVYSTLLLNAPWPRLVMILGARNRGDGYADMVAATVDSPSAIDAHKLVHDGKQKVTATATANGA